MTKFILHFSQKCCIFAIAALTLAACSKHNEQMVSSRHQKVTFSNQYGIMLVGDLYPSFTGESSGESKHLIPWDTLADFFNNNLK